MEEGRFIVSVSGGKDSCAQTLALVEKYGRKSIIALHFQVIPEQWEETLGYVQHFADFVGLPLICQQAVYQPREGGWLTLARIVDIESRADIVEDNGVDAITGSFGLALSRGHPPTPKIRFCTSYLKRDLVDKWIRQRRSDLPATFQVCLGVRALESRRRAKVKERVDRIRWKSGEGQLCENWLPIRDWTRRDVFRKMRDWGIEPHPAYKLQGMNERDMYDRDVEGGPRVSCRFCIYATKSDVCHQVELESNRLLFDRLLEVERVTEKTWWMGKSGEEFAVALAGVEGGPRQLALPM